MIIVEMIIVELLKTLFRRSHLLKKTQKLSFNLIYCYFCKQINKSKTQNKRTKSKNNIVNNYNQSI